MLKPPNILTIAGSDSGGGAGIQADIKTIMALDGYGMSVITALTAQNGLGVAGIEAPSADFVALQLLTVLDGFDVQAAKTGMLYSAAIIEAIAPILRQRAYPLVVDPVSVSQSGSRLLRDKAVDAIKSLLLPGCDLLTPNIPELELFSGQPIASMDDGIMAANVLLELGAKAVLVKGGHLASSITINDVLCRHNLPPKTFSQPYIETTNNHGTGCTLSAAIACELGKGLPLEVAISHAQKYLNEALRRSYAPGKGSGPANHRVQI